MPVEDQPALVKSLEVNRQNRWLLRSIRLETPRHSVIAHQCVRAKTWFGSAPLPAAGLPHAASGRSRARGTQTVIPGFLTAGVRKETAGAFARLAALFTFRKPTREPLAAKQDRLCRLRLLGAQACDWTTHSASTNSSAELVVMVFCGRQGSIDPFASNDRLALSASRPSRSVTHVRMILPGFHWR